MLWNLVGGAVHHTLHDFLPAGTWHRTRRLFFVFILIMIVHSKILYGKHALDPHQWSYYVKNKILCACAVYMVQSVAAERCTADTDSGCTSIDSTSFGHSRDISSWTEVSPSVCWQVCYRVATKYDAESSRTKSKPSININKGCVNLYDYEYNYATRPAAINMTCNS